MLEPTPEAPHGPWDQVLRKLEDRIAPQNFDMWLRPIECCGMDGSTLKLRAPNPYVRLWFESNYLPVVLDELKDATQTQFAVEFEPEAESLSGAQEWAGAPAESHLPSTVDGIPVMVHTPESSGAFPVVSPGAADSQGRVEASSFGTEAPFVNIELNHRYTFSTFVAGPSNQLAFAASQAAASTYPPKYNPVFVCGGVGLGKTHLLHAIGHKIIELRPRSRLLYISGERFMNEYVHAIRTNRMHDFRTRYRENCDVLLVDDVQFLAGKDGTQDEFFHTFNALHDAHRQIVLTADRKPNEISDIADRLRTRFAWGLLADIEPPELEVRMAILRQKAAAERIHLPHDIAMYIASAIRSNVRELEGALIRLAACASLSGREITMDFAKQTLEGALGRGQEQLTVEHVLKAVASYYNVKVGDLKSPRRHKSVSGPRAVAMYLARTHTSESYPDLGRAFGGKHHTTILSAVEKTLERLKTDVSLRSEVHAVESLLLK